MDDFNNEGLRYLFLILAVFNLVILVFVLSYINLYRFKECYDNDFTLKYCEKYKNY